LARCDAREDSFPSARERHVQKLGGLWVVAEVLRRYQKVVDRLKREAVVKLNELLGDPGS
jgi:hypothetical protein